MVVATTVRLPEDLHAALKRRAAKLDRSLHWCLVTALREWLGDEVKPVAEVIAVDGGVVRPAAKRVPRSEKPESLPSEPRGVPLPPGVSKGLREPCVGKHDMTPYGVCRGCGFRR